MQFSREYIGLKNNVFTDPFTQGFIYVFMGFVGGNTVLGVGILVGIYIERYRRNESEAVSKGFKLVRVDDEQIQKVEG